MQENQGTPGYRVTIFFRGGQQEVFTVHEFSLAPPEEAESLTAIRIASYKTRSGEEARIYLNMAEIAAIKVDPTTLYGG